MIDLKDKKILVTGGAGFLGSRVVEFLVKSGFHRDNITVPRSKEHDLRSMEVCKKIVQGHGAVIHLAAKVGGIGYNREHPAELFFDNAIMGIQLIEAARLAGVEKFVQVGTVCAYPKYTQVPFHEEDLWSGYPEETNAPYGLAKRMLLVQAQAYRQQYGLNVIFLIPVNLYGPCDNFNENSSHVIPALIKKFCDAVDKGESTVTIWGTGIASREFLYVEDAAQGIVSAFEKYNKPDPINLGVGQEVTIRYLAEKIAALTHYKGSIVWDTTKPDGQPRRMLDVSRAQREFGFQACMPLEKGLKATIEWYISLKNRS